MFFLISLALMAGALPGFAAKSYRYFRVGASVDVVRATTGGTVLMGGATDVDAAFQWMCSHGGNGDFVVVGATGTDAYNAYIQGLCPAVNSVSTLIIPSRAAASDPDVTGILQKAEAIFIMGGDQSNYINYWKGTPVQSALNAAIGRAVPIGGTSAGMDVLTQFIYSAQLSQGVSSSQALANPFSKYITLDRDFVNIATLAGMLGDAHFVTRDRMGRNLAFLCRLYTNGWPTSGRGIAVDEGTALLIETTGTATVVGTSTVYFLQAPGRAEVCVSNTPLTYRNVAVYRISSSGTFNLSTWLGTGGTAYRVSAEAGVLSSTQAQGDIY